MAKILNIADKIKASLATVDELDETCIIVDRNRQLDSEFQKAISKSGIAVVVAPTSNRNDSDDAAGPSLNVTFEVIISQNPQLKGANSPYIMDVVEKVICHLHLLDLCPNDSCYRDIIFRSTEPIPHPKISMYKVTCTMLVDLMSDDF